MPDDRFDIGVFGPDDDDDDFREGPIIDVTPGKEKPESNETDGHILDDLLKNQQLDRSDKTVEDEEESSVGFVVIIIVVILIAVLFFLLF